jgi:antitoxin ParD1/3/4
MPNVQLTETMQDYVERQVKIGAYANVSEVVRAGIRKLMDEDGAAAFYALKRDLQEAMAEPDEEVDLDELFGLKGQN